MPGGSLVVLLGENVDRTERSLAFAFELSKRLESRLAVLVVTDGDGELPPASLRRLEERVRDVGRDHAVEVETVARRGDPASELIKFLARASGVRALVWSGDESVLRAPRGSRAGRHWLGRLRQQIACPIVTTAGRKKAGTRP